MGRSDANSGPSQRGRQHQQPQEYHFQPATQIPETIDDAPPPPFETSNDENQQENSAENDPPEKVENARQNQQAQSRPIPSRGPMAFPPQNTQMRSPPSGHQPQAFPPASQDEPQAFPPPQEEAQPFPPSQGQPQTFPPPQDHQAHAFPPPHDHQAQAFPPPQDPQPQAFPPPQDHQAQAFPPPQNPQAQAFPPPQGQPQAFPSQQHAFQQPNAEEFQQAFASPTMGVGQIPISLTMSSSPLVHLNAHQAMNTPIPGFPMAQVLPTQAWKTSLFGCMDDPTNGKLELNTETLLKPRKRTCC